MVLSGLLGALGDVGFGQFYLGWLFLMPAFWAIRGTRPRRASLLGLAGGSVAGFAVYHGLAMAVVGVIDARMAEAQKITVGLVQTNMGLRA